jgi:hypothetical protein
MRRAPYSPFVEKETAPVPWYCGREMLGLTVGIVLADRVVGPRYPSDFVGYGV